MVRRISQLTMMALLLIIMGTLGARAQSDETAYNYDAAQIDRYLDVEVWADHSDGEYYDGDNIVIYYRVNRDAFVSIYSIDTRGRVNLLFPTGPSDDNYIRGGVTYSLPAENADYDLEVSGPEGFENIQMIASRENFTIPDWYGNSGMVCDWDNRADYMDYLNNSFFVRYGGQRFAYDRAAIYVNNWEPNYFRPVYYPEYPSWTVYGNCYIDYPWGSSIYVNGVYWGCAPLYIPRIAVGWHTITIYDVHGYCWENDFHVSHYNTVVFDRTEIHPRSDIKSKYKEVQEVGYRDPVTHGYPKFKEHNEAMGALTGGVLKESGKVLRAGGSVTDGVSDTPSRKYVRGSTKVIKTDRGYETDASTAVFTGTGATRTGRTSRPTTSYDNRTRTSEKGKSSGYVGKSDRNSGSDVTSGAIGREADAQRKSEESSQKNASEYYQKKSGRTTKSESGTVERKSSDNNASHDTPSVERRQEPARKSSDNPPAVKEKERKSTEESRPPVVKEAERKKTEESRPAVKSQDNTSRSSDEKKSDDRSSHNSDSRSKSKR
jgi:hypothetical protein